MISACSSVDRAPASGAGCVGSIPIRRIEKKSVLFPSISYWETGQISFYKKQQIENSEKPLAYGQAKGFSHSLRCVFEEGRAALKTSGYLF